VPLVRRELVELFRDLAQIIAACARICHPQVASRVGYCYTVLTSPGRQAMALRGESSVNMTDANTPRLPVLTNQTAWRLLPGAPPAEERLPAWARMLVGVLPLTTARALELDAMHRTGDRLDPRLRALARWSAADANGCEYGRELAATDLARNPEPLSPVERAVVAFSRRMMTEAFAVTDAEVAQLLGFLGEERLVALVALLAHASYQDRIILALGAREDGAIPPPVAARFARPRPAPPPTLSAPIHNEVDVESPTAAWGELREQLARQKARPGRIRIPSRAEVLERLGEGHPLAWQAGIAWSRACYTYQPELTDAWFGCTGAFRQETDLDMVFQNSVFWVITDAVRCFY
jgi:alkylhydroperoxidase family enzyme